MTETIFDIYTKEVTINGQTYKIRPLSGRFLPKFYKVIGKLSEGNADGKQDVNPTKLFEDAEAMEALHTIGLETLKKSYPETKVEQLDEFVSQNLLKMLEVLIQVNMPSDKA
jgi:hypothetical protein